ncbi:hypothetical protein [Agathobaculum sp.]|uniref:hypothetical protein n=1 Tax=Agathobaculum sp. TaxID=2048138 RepID=UPI002A7F926B|nr:hypothetical protein [Agathobaculum sp.]MDY3617409.1 hypothetical protein [Agathobaculum sp.]
MHEYQPQMALHSAVHAVVAIVDSGQGARVLHICRENHVLLDFVCMAHGTARTEMLDLLGLGETPKEVVICLTGETAARRLLGRLGSDMKMRYPGRGIAFTIPVGSLGVRLHKLLTQEEPKEGQEMNSTGKNEGYDVVAVILDQGYTSRIMDVARREGARGGTVITARGIAEDEVRQFFGIEIQAEKEIVFLVVRSGEKQRIMTEIMKAAGLNTESHGIVLSLPVSSAIGLAD